MITRTFSATHEETASFAPGAIFCLRAAGESADKPAEPGYPLAPHYLVHVGEDGAVVHTFTQAKQILDHLKRLCSERAAPDAAENQVS